MENPEHEIKDVVRSLCQGTPDEQRRTLDMYFTKDASFVHPFCMIPHFNEGDLIIPGLSQLSSRDVVRGVFHWYRMLSPRIDIEIDTALLDKARDRMYLDIRQTFSVWFAPMYHADVRLVTVLDLVACDLNRHNGGEPQVIKREEGHRPMRHHVSAGHGHGQYLWKISKQEDLYQVNEFLKFTGPYWWCLWRPFWLLFQLGASATCVFLSLFVALSPWAFQREPARGGVESSIEQVESYHDHEEPDNNKKAVNVALPGESGSIGVEGASSNGHNNRRAINTKASSSTSPNKAWKKGEKALR